MQQSSSIREALRIFRLALVIQLVLLGLSVFSAVRLGADLVPALVLRMGPTLLLMLLMLPPWFEGALGRWFLALGLGVDLVVVTLESAPVFFERQALLSQTLNLSQSIEQQLATVQLVEPFLFLLVPLVLLAWAYGRRGALWGSAWATVLLLAGGYWAVQLNLLSRTFSFSLLGRVALIFLVPLMVGVLAERERKDHAELEKAHEQLRHYTATAEQLATSRERNRMARDLHDTLAHSLAAISVDLEALRTLLAHDPEAARGVVDELSALARRGLAESRQAIQALRSDRLETQGLAGALRDELAAFQDRTGVPCDLKVAGEEPVLTPEEAQAFYYIADEALANVELHADAEHVTVRLGGGQDRVDLVIQDDGCGFDPDGVAPDRYGLTGMRERAAMVGAALEVSSRPDGGTEVWCTLKR